MYSVFIGTPLSSYSIIPLLFPNLGISDKPSWLFQRHAFSYLNTPVVNIISQPKKADFLLVPHHYDLVRTNKNYLQTFHNLAQQYRKQLIIFDYGDNSHSLPYPNTIVFKTSQYRHKLQPNEIIMPAYTEDLGRQAKFREKNKTPIIGFCGWATYNSTRQEVIAKIRKYILVVKSIVLNNNTPLFYQPGILLRSDIIARLRKSRKVKTNFIVRKSYSGHTSTISVDSKKARQEFIDSLKNSDFILTIKGNGNYSQRFYEGLSMGRIPIIVDTDNVFPLEDKIPYSQFSLILSLKDMSRIDQIVASYYQVLSPSDYQKKQQKAQHYYRRYLRIDQYFKYLFLEQEIRHYARV